MNLTNMELQESRRLKREIEAEISEREGRELGELFELSKEYFYGRAPQLTRPIEVKAIRTLRIAVGQNMLICVASNAVP